MASTKDDGIIRLSSTLTVSEVLAQLLALLEAKGVTVFTVVDHSGEAEKVGLAMPATKLVIFGNPKAGTPVMLASPASALDLPLKILIAESPDGATTISYNSVAYLQERHGLSPELAANLSVIDQIAVAAAR